MRRIQPFNLNYYIVLIDKTKSYFFNYFRDRFLDSLVLYNYVDLINTLKLPYFSLIMKKINQSNENIAKI